ncbi:MAG: NHL repeat-containing protein [Planctomycetota bacterium]
MTLPLVLCLLAQAAGAEQDAGSYPSGRFGEYLATHDGLLGPVDLVALEDGSLVLVERDADRLTRLAADGTAAAFGPADLDAPLGIAALPGGGYFVADTGNDRVLVLGDDGSVQRAWGERGDGTGATFRGPAGVAANAELLAVADAGNGIVQLYDRAGVWQRSLSAPLARPVAVALDGDGTAFVVDAGRHRVEVFDASGEHRFGWGDFGPHAGLFGHPSDVALGTTDGATRVYVSDADNHRVQVFTSSGKPIYEWGKHALRPREGAGSLHYPSGIALTPDGSTALVCEAFQDRVQRFGPTERDPALFMTDPTITPWKVAPHYGMELATARDLLILFEPETQVVLVHDLELDEPVLVCRMASFGDGPGQLREIADVAIDPATWTVHVTDRGRGTLSSYVLDHEPDAPLKNDPRKGSFARSVDLSAALGEAPGTIVPGAVALGPDGALAVVDERAGRVLLLDARGQRTGEVGGFDAPADLVWSEGELFVSDRGARSVVVVATDGSGRRSIGGFARPHGIAVDGSGEERELYVVDEAEHRVRVLNPAGEELRSFGSKGLGATELYRPRGIGIDERGRVLVLDHGNHRGQAFGRSGEFLLAFGSRSYVKLTRRPRSESR